MVEGSWRGVKVERGLWSESLQDDEITSARQRVQQPSPTRVQVHMHMRFPTASTSASLPMGVL